MPLIISALQQEPVNTCIHRAVREGVAILTDNVAVATDAECCRTQRPCGIYEPWPTISPLELMSQAFVASASASVTGSRNENLSTMPNLSMW